MDQLVWEPADLHDQTSRQTLAEDIASLEAGRNESGLFHNLAWLLEAEGRSPDDVRIYVCRAHEGLRA